MLAMAARCAGLHDSGGAARAATSPAPVLDAGPADVSTLSGVLVFDRATMASSNPPQEAIFAATASGEQLFDLRYPATRAATLASYHSQLAGLRKFKAKYTKAAYQQALSDLQEQRLMATRSVWTSAGHDSTLTFFETDALTNRLAKVRYDEMGWNGSSICPAMTRSCRASGRWQASSRRSRRGRRPWARRATKAGLRCSSRSQPPRRRPPGKP